MVEIINIENDPEVSVLFAKIEALCENKKYSVEKKDTITSETKGELITVLAIGIATNLLYDIIKFSVKSLFKGKKIAKKIKIDGKDIDLDDFI